MSTAYCLSSLNPRAWFAQLEREEEEARRRETSEEDMREMIRAVERI
jgi:hypothetical protein